MLVDRLHDAGAVIERRREHDLAAGIGQAVVGDDLAGDELLDDVVDGGLVAEVALEVDVVLELVGARGPDADVRLGDDRVADLPDERLEFGSGSADVAAGGPEPGAHEPLLHQRLALDDGDVLRVDARDVEVGAQPRLGLEPVLVERIEMVDLPWRWVK